MIIFVPTSLFKIDINWQLLPIATSKAKSAEKEIQITRSTCT